MGIKDKEPPGQGKYLIGGDLLHGEEGAPPEMGIEVSDLPENKESGAQKDDDQPDWMQLARDALEFSTDYVDSNYRKKWEDGIRAFNGQHPLDSKYSSPNYAKRSNIYRPKTRSVIRKNEAAASAAFFNNPDVISVESENQGDQKARASAAVMKELINYRTSKSIPWYLTVLGGVQDAQTVGVVVSHQYWEYEERDGKVITDKPCVDLIAVENLRIDPGADWRDPVETSPYLIELIPMYIGAVLDKMERMDPKTGAPQWKSYGLGTLRQAMEYKTDTTRMTRNKDRADPNSSDAQPVSDYEICWVHRHIHRYNGEDWTFYTLADVALLTDPVSLKEVVHHGKRPYALGCAIIETHKTMPSGLPELSRGLQSEVNDVANTTLDNVYFVLNKMWLVKRGSNADLPALVRNTPGRIALTNNPETDIKEVNWPDVTSSSWQQTDRLNADFSDLTGDFSANQAQIARKGSEPGKIMQLQAQSGTPLTEYLLRTIAVTWIEKVLRQLVLLEQEYETDATVLALAGERAKVLQKFGINAVTDELLKGELTIRVNMGLGATDPFQKLQKLLLGVTQFKEIATQPPAGLNVGEVGKEIFGLLGYQDGVRFFGDQDPEKVALRQQLQHAGQIIQELGKRHEDKSHELASKEKIAHEGNLTTITTAAMSKDPAVARVILQKLGPGQGFQLPVDLPPLDDGKDAAKEQAGAKEAAQREAQEKDAERKIKLEVVKVGATKDIALEELRHRHAKEIAEHTAKLARETEEHKQGVPAKIDAVKTDPLKKVVEELAQVVKESLKATKELAEVIANPPDKVKTARFTKDKNGNFVMEATEKVA